MKPTIRKYLLPLHRWSGLSIGLVIVLMAVSGAAIMFRPQLEPVFNRDLLTVDSCSERVPLDTLTANAVAARPFAKLDYIRILAADQGDARMPASMVRFTDETLVYLNPCSGAVLGQRHRFGGVLGTIEQVHRFRFMHNGSLVSGTSALLFALLLILGGLLMWLPATLGGLRNALKFDGRLRGRARTLNLHKSAGVYASLIVLTSALTGLPQAFDWYRDGLYAITGSAPPAPAPRVSAPAGASRLPMETLWQRAQALMPQPSDALLHYPAKPGEAMDMYLIERGAPHVNARSLLYLDAYTGQTVRLLHYADSSIGNKLYFWTLSLHTGHIGGIFGQLILLAGALTMPVLAYTGIGSYLRRRSAARAAPSLQRRYS